MSSEEYDDMCALLQLSKSDFRDLLSKEGFIESQYGHLFLDIAEN
jgi:formylmethanofuran dehydrogenase subunit D